MEKTFRNRLRLVPKATGPKPDFRAMLQQPLFSEAALTVVFAFFPELAESTFIDLIRCSCAGVVLDLRRVPRFDIGKLDREEAFRLFASAATTYVDAAASVSGRNVTEELAEKIREAVGLTSGPLVFLFGREDSSLASRSEIIDALEHTGRPFEIIPVPS
jgi:hypothetical protein